MQKSIVQQVRLDRILKAQEEEKCIADLKTYLIGDVATLSAEELKVSAVIAPDYEVDRSGLLLFCPRSANRSDDRVVEAAPRQAAAYRYEQS